MCWCTPNKRMPFCGSPKCHPPAQPERKTAIIDSHTYEPMSEGMRPQDPSLKGDGLKFEPLEHGGEYPDTMPQAIRLTDAEGRWCIYEPTTVAGKVVRSHGYSHKAS